MKIKSGYIFRNIADQPMVIPVSDRIADFNGIISLNEAGAFLWRLLEPGAERDELISALLGEYDLSRTDAEKDVDDFIKILSERNVLENQ
ncbi:MAG: PqqD family protein [Oscillospiraceae bacterium]|nr:PqqD family protein [Oscillospiraceae bacterium]